MFSRDLLVVSDECVQDGGTDWPKLVWMVDARDESNLVPISTLPMPPVGRFRQARRPLRRAQHARKPARCRRPSIRRTDLRDVFNGGVRVYNISNPFQPEEVAVFRPAARRPKSPAGAIQDQRRLCRRKPRRLRRGPLWRRAIRSRMTILVS